MANPLDMVTQPEDDDLSSLPRIVVRPDNIPAGANGPGVPEFAPTDNSLTQAVQPDNQFDLMKGLAILADYVKNGQFSPGTKIGNKLFGAGGEERYQTWPERMVRSGFSLPGDVMSGAEPLPMPGLRREDFTDVPPPQERNMLGLRPSEWQPGDRVIERAQDTAGLMGGGALTERPGGAALGSGPMLPGAKAVPAELTPAPVFYSALEHVASNAAQDTMSPQQWLGYLKNQPGVKAEELAWTGLPDWLAAQKGKVKKEDVQAYLDEHKVEIKDVTKHGDEADTFSNSDYDAANEAALEVMQEQWNDLPAAERAKHGDDIDTWLQEHEQSNRFSELETMWLDENAEPQGGPHATKYEGYQLPGGENYREHLLTMPSRMNSLPEGYKVIPMKDAPPNHRVGNSGYVVMGPDGGSFGSGATAADATKSALSHIVAESPQSYRSSHWDEPNVLAHVRTNDRTMPREPTPEQTAATEARAKVQEQIADNRKEQGVVARQINDQANILRGAHYDKLWADYHANKIDRKALNDGLENPPLDLPELKPLQDQLQQLRAKEDGLTSSIEDIVPKVLSDEQALVRAKDWVNEGNPNSQKWDKTPPERQAAWAAQMHKIAGRKAMDEAAKPIKSLHLEEIQSDWHQQGRKQGYSKGPEKLTTYLVRGKDGNGWGYYATEQDAKNAIAAQNLEGATIEPHHQTVQKGVPDAPFKTSWPELALKRMVRKAAEEGYDRISWTPGEAQAARYDLSKHIDKLELTHNRDGAGELFMHPKDGRAQKVAIQSKGDLVNAVGKDLADKLYEQGYANNGRANLEGVDLKVGGEGMREFYDKMLPKMAEKAFKSHGVKVKRTSMKLGPRDEVGHPVHYFDIPQSLREQAIGKGFPLYMQGIPFPLTPVDYDPFKKEQK